MAGEPINVTNPPVAAVPVATQTVPQPAPTPAPVPVPVPVAPPAPRPGEAPGVIDMNTTVTAPDGRRIRVEELLAGYDAAVAASLDRPEMAKIVQQVVGAVADDPSLLNELSAAVNQPIAAPETPVAPVAPVAPVVPGSVSAEMRNVLETIKGLVEPIRQSVDRMAPTFDKIKGDEHRTRLKSFLENKQATYPNLAKHAGAIERLIPQLESASKAGADEQKILAMIGQEESYLAEFAPDPVQQPSVTRTDAESGIVPGLPAPGRVVDAPAAPAAPQNSSALVATTVPGAGAPAPAVETAPQSKGPMTGESLEQSLAAQASSMGIQVPQAH